MANRTFVFRLVVCGMVLMVCDLISIPGYYNWSYGEREDLFCPDTCKRAAAPDRCCSCEGRRCWVLNTTSCPIGVLSVEYMDIFGTSVILGPNNFSYLEFIHTKGSLTKIPGNICVWKAQLVTLDLRYNRLSDVKIVQCLEKLDTLRLDFNLIKYVENTTFTKMKDLRMLTMSHNLIMRLDPNVIIIEGGNIPIVDFTDNMNMDFLDISNMFRPGPFCTLNFTNSYIEHITNDLGFILEEVIHGPGDILLEHTHIGSFINFTSIGLEDLAELGKYIDGQLSIDASSINCDCTVFPILDSMGSEVSKYWKNVDQETFECHSPESMKGKNLTDIIETGNFGDLTCDISENPDCPHYLCHCIDMPSEHKVLVNCTGVGFTSMPDQMPIGVWNNYKIDLILVENNITVLPDRKYYSRLVNLNLRQNDITLFTENAAENISSKLNIESQILEKLPRTLHYKDPNLITFGLHPVVCDCSNTWIGDWIRLKHGHGRLKCLINGEVIPAEDVSEFTLNCNQITPLPSVAIVSAAIGCITLFVVIIGLSYLFRYEIIILKRTLSKKKFIEGIHNIDVFLSFSEDNDDVFRMVSRYIKPGLFKAGYTVFNPWEDIPYGTQRDDELAIAVDRSVNYLIILSDNYSEYYQTVSEMEIIWNSFLTDKTKQIILINYDNLDSNAIKDERLRALRRTRCLDFTARGSKLISRLINKIGTPLTIKKCDNLNELVSSNEDDPVSEENVGMLANGQDESLDRDKVNVNDKVSVFNRLAKHRDSECNCKYRKCYLHGEALIHRPKKLALNTHTNKVIPL